MLYLNRDVKQGGRQTHLVYYGKAGDEVRLISAHRNLPAIICEHVPANGREPFPATLCCVSWKEVESEAVLAPLVESVKRPVVKAKPTAAARAKKVIITNQIEMF